MVPGYKKGDPTNTENYRYFALSWTLSKVARRGLAETIYQYIKDEIPHNYFGFAKNRGTNDASHMIRRVVEQFLWSRNLHLYIPSLDFYKAYDRIFTEVVRSVLNARGFEGPVYQLVTSFLEPTCLVAGLNGFFDNPTFSQSRGLPTGAPEASVIFLALSIWWDRGQTGVGTEKPVLR